MIEDIEIMKFVNYYLGKRLPVFYNLKDKEDLRGYIILFIYENKDKYNPEIAAKTTFLNILCRTGTHRYFKRKSNREYHDAVYLEDELSELKQDVNFLKFEDEHIINVLRNKLKKEKQKTVFDLMYQGYNLNQIGKKMNITGSAVSLIKKQIKEELRAEWRKINE